MFPISNKNKFKTGYKFGDKTFYSDFHLGLDILCPEGTFLLAPFDGEIIRQFIGNEGGLTIWFKPDHDDVVIRFLHLSKWFYPKAPQRVQKGLLIGYTGNTGKTTTGPHLHIDISKKEVILNNRNNFIDPDKYDWEPKMNKIKISFALVDLPFKEKIIEQVNNTVKFYKQCGIELEAEFWDTPEAVGLDCLYNYIYETKQYLHGKEYIYRGIKFDFLKFYSKTDRINCFLYNGRNIKGLSNLTLKEGWIFSWLFPKTMVQMPVVRWFVDALAENTGLSWFECMLRHELVHACYAFIGKRETLDLEISQLKTESEKQDLVKLYLLKLNQ